MRRIYSWPGCHVWRNWVSSYILFLYRAALVTHLPKVRAAFPVQRVVRARANLSLALCLFLPFGFQTCSNSSSTPNNNSRAQASPQAAPTVSPSIATANASAGIAFDGDRAFAHVKKMVETGPRVAGSKELARTREYIISELRSYGLQVSTDEFRTKTPVGERRMVNVTAELPGETSDVIMLASHYDTKLYKEFRFVGANDGGSSTGALLEMARVLAAGKQRPRFTYWFVFFDGEEAVCKNWDDCGTPTAPDNTYGSRRFVARLIDRNELKRVRAMILLDMIGYKKLELGRDPMSSRWLVDIIWQTAREMKYEAYFVDREEGVGGDDHEPFLRAGVDAVDLIQLNSYPHWHTAEDTLDKISPRSLQVVGEVVLASLPRIEERLLSKRAGA